MATTKKAVATRKKAAVTRMPAPAPVSVHPGQMIQALMTNPDVDIDKVTQLFELQTKYEEREAKKAYHAAMSNFQALVPQITYDDWVNYPSKDGKSRTDFAFASLAGTLAKIQETMMDCGLTATWRTKSEDNGSTTITCVITHQLGHSETTSLTAAADTSGGKNSIQAVKSTSSYLRRITLEAMLGLAAKGEDDDGNGATPTVQKVSAADIKQLTTLMAKAKADVPKFLKAFDIEAIDELPLDQVARATAVLNRKIKESKNDKV